MEFLVRKENQRVFLNNQELLGVQTVESSTEHSTFDGGAAGLNSNLSYSQGHSIGRINLSYLLIHRDYFLPYTGVSGFDLFIVNPSNGNEIYGGLSGFVNSYSLESQIGSTPRCSVDISFFKNFGRMQASDSQHISNILAGNIIEPYVNPSAQGTILATGYRTNLAKLNSLSLNISVSRRPEYILGQKEPTGITLVEPINVNLELDLNLKDAEIPSSKDLIEKDRTDNFIISIRGENRIGELAGFYFADMDYKSQSNSSNLGLSNTTINYSKQVYLRPNVITNGLLWFYDSTNPNSYPGGGNGSDWWYDLSLSEKPASLNSMLSPQKTGFMFFSGENASNRQSVMGINLSGENNKDLWSICFWMKSEEMSGVYFSFSDGPHLHGLGNKFYWTNQNTPWLGPQYGKLIDTSIIGSLNNFKNKWNHICLTTQSSNALFYLNGIRTLNADTGVYSYSTLGKSILAFGNTTGTSTTPIPFTGYLDRILVYNRILSMTEVRENMQATKIT